MSHRTQIEIKIQRWKEAGLIDEEGSRRILAFEAGQERGTTLKWPVFLAMAFGGILLAAGITLFVAAHWSELSPAMRFTLVLLMVVVFHVGGALTARNFPALSTTMHGIGTATLGAAIFLTAQIFNLHENWATGILLWAIGAAIGYVLLRDWVQAACLALLVPAWLIGQWIILTEGEVAGSRSLMMGLLLTAICYLSARIGDQENTARRTLVWIGGIALLPCVATGIVMAMEEWAAHRYSHRVLLPLASRLTVWIVAIAGPLLLALFLRGRSAWINLLWVGWAYALLWSAGLTNGYRSGSTDRQFVATLELYGLCAIGSVGLVAWGLYEKRKERVNLGVLAFAISVLFFYFDSFMGKLGRSASLLVLGVLCLAGGYVLEVTRRRLMARMEVSQ